MEWPARKSSRGPKNNSYIIAERCYTSVCMRSAGTEERARSGGKTSGARKDWTLTVPSFFPSRLNAVPTLARTPATTMPLDGFSLDRLRPSTVSFSLTSLIVYRLRESFHCFPDSLRYPRSRAGRPTQPVRCKDATLFVLVPRLFCTLFETTNPCALAAGKSFARCFSTARPNKFRSNRKIKLPLCDKFAPSPLVK